MSEENDTLNIAAEAYGTAKLSLEVSMALREQLYALQTHIAKLQQTLFILTEEVDISPYVREQIAEVWTNDDE